MNDTALLEQVLRQNQVILDLLARKEELLRPETVADMLCVDRSTVYKLQREGRLPCVRIGEAVRFRLSDIEGFIANGGTKRDSVLSFSRKTGAGA